MLVIHIFVGSYTIYSLFLAETYSLHLVLGDTKCAESSSRKQLYKNTSPIQERTDSADGVRVPTPSSDGVVQVDWRGPTRGDQLSAVVECPPLSTHKDRGGVIASPPPCRPVPSTNKYSHRLESICHTQCFFWRVDSWTNCYLEKILEERRKIFSVADAAEALLLENYLQARHKTRLPQRKCVLTTNSSVD